MMPTAKKKLGAIGLFGRTGGDSSPRAGAVGLPATPAPASALSGKNHPLSSGHATNNAQRQQPQLAQLQPPHEIVATSRQQDKHDTPATAASRSIPVLKGLSGRYSSVTHSHYHGQPPPASMSMSLPAQHFHPMQRTRTTASDTAARGPPRAQNAWEDSTVASMFNDTESRAASDITHTRQNSHARQYSNTDSASGPPPAGAYQRQHQALPQLPAPPQASRRDQQQHQTYQHQQQHGPTNENLPFVIGDNGILTVVASPHQQSALPVTGGTATNLALSSDKADDVYHEDWSIYETPTKNSALRRTRLPYRDTRGLKDATYSPSGSQYSPRRAESLSMSPERAAEAGEHLEQVRIEERRKRDRERQRERERELERQKEREVEQERDLQHKRSTIFENLTPLEFDDDDNFNDTRAGVIANTSAVDPDELTEALQSTPRVATRKLPPPVLPLPLAVKKDLITTAAVAGPLGRNSSTKRRIIREPLKPSTKSLKRRQSLDYNDAELYRMSYSDLRKEAFDYDPQAAAAIEQQTSAKQQLPPPHPGGSIEQRMEYYKSQGSLDQHQFFTRISVDEWDEAGDWFLEQFGAVVQKFKKARKSKRQLIAQFEDEISAREEAVRGKIEGIGRTLEDLKHEGQNMMQGKDTDLE
ncbi:extracellular mutant protein 11-domain-containing protein [Triangularia verruculosa]|uniref:Extracellular mutant protein 11-domain-containing protein n=1 Tax=Triangularia verruculosa TaxID=2587418 RepID=A0AAN6XQR1_9PEZI|nr:extracellular mutant protein 11-domain-containing protein [Triangularia verruculosa]